MTEQSLDALISRVANAEQDLTEARDARESAEQRENYAICRRDEARDELKREIEQWKLAALIAEGRQAAASPAKIA